MRFDLRSGALSFDDDIEDRLLAFAKSNVPGFLDLGGTTKAIQDLCQSIVGQGNEFVRFLVNGHEDCADVVVEDSLDATYEVGCRDPWSGRK